MHGAGAKVYRELTHGTAPGRWRRVPDPQAGKGNKFWGFKPPKDRLAKLRWFRVPLHEGSAPNHGTSKSWSSPEFGAPKPRPLLDRHTHTRPEQDLENPKYYRLLGTT